jgi:mannosyltransferase OCH1-like enzyme
MKIPRTFHQIWLGKQPMPTEFLAWQKTWTNLNPGWDLKLWTEDNLLPTRWPNLVKRAHGYSQMSNIYRYEILLQEGGVYVDTDCECVKPIEPLISDCDAFVVLTKRTHITIGCGTIGGIAGHPLFRKLVESLHLVDPSKRLSMGSAYMTEITARHLNTLNRPDVKVIPSSLMNPYDCTELKDGRPRPKCEFPDAYVLHHWSSRWHPTGFTALQPI